MAVYICSFFFSFPVLVLTFTLRFVIRRVNSPVIHVNYAFFKAIVHPIMKSMSSCTHPRVESNPYVTISEEQKRRCLIEWQLNFTFIVWNKMLWKWKDCQSVMFCLTSLLLFHWWKKVIEVWNTFWGTYSTLLALEKCAVQWTACIMKAAVVRRHEMRPKTCCRPQLKRGNIRLTEGPLHCFSVQRLRLMLVTV